MHKKAFLTKRRIILIVLLFLFIIAFLTIILPNNNGNYLTDITKDTTTSFEKIIYSPFRFIATKINDYKSLKDIRKKYQALLPEIERIDSLKAENIELRKELADLKEELKIDHTLSEYEFLNATVINRNVATWYNTITIDKGSYNGVEKDMAVVSSHGLIGKVISTSTFTSNVRLITTSDTKNKISITIASGNNYVHGLIKNYNYKTGYLEIEGISNTERILKDSYVYTSGLGGIFPSGILVAKVTNIKTDEYDLAKLIDATPIVDFNDINYVAILKRKEKSE